MNVADACFHTIHDYPGGAEALGPRLGKRGTSLSHEVQPRSPADIAAMQEAGRTVPKFSVLDAERVMKMTKELGRADLRILTALATSMGCMVLQLPDMDADELPAAADVAKVAREFGALMGRVAQTLADGKVTDNELAEVERQSGLLIASMQHLLAGMGRMNAELRAEAPGAISPGGTA